MCKVQNLHLLISKNKIHKTAYNLYFSILPLHNRSNKSNWISAWLAGRENCFILDQSLPSGLDYTFFLLPITMQQLHPGFIWFKVSKCYPIIFSRNMPELKFDSNSRIKAYPSRFTFFPSSLLDITLNVIISTLAVVNGGFPFLVNMINSNYSCILEFRKCFHIHHLIWSLQFCLSEQCRYYFYKEESWDSERLSN